MDKNLRTHYSKFRLSSHKLLVERGRWMKTKLQYEMRKCTLRDSEVLRMNMHHCDSSMPTVLELNILKSITIYETKYA